MSSSSRNAGSTRRLEFELGAGFEGAGGFALVLALSQMMEHGLGCFGRADLHPHRGMLPGHSVKVFEELGAVAFEMGLGRLLSLGRTCQVRLPLGQPLFAELFGGAVTAGGNLS